MSSSVVLFAPSESHREQDDACAAVESVRVLHLINGEHFAGAERVQDLLALRLPEFHYEVGFACVKPDRFPSLRKSQECPLYALPMKSKLDLSPAFAVARRVRREGYALIHTHTPRAALVGRLAASLARVPMVHHVHSPTDLDSTHPWRNRLNAIGERLSLCRVSALIAVSHHLGSWAQTQGFPRCLVHVVHNGVPSPGPLLERPAPKGSWTLGVMALFRPRKGLEVLLEALAVLRAKQLPVKLRAVGSFETAAYQHEIMRRVEQLGLSRDIEWAGFRQDIAGELARMDLLVLPSLFGEGLPMVVLEAMAAGVPVVASRVKGVDEAVRDGQDGLLVEPADSHSLARALIRLAHGELDWTALRQSAHRRHAEQFSDRVMARGVAEIYHKVLSR